MAAGFAARARRGDEAGGGGSADMDDVEARFAARRKGQGGRDGNGLRGFVAGEGVVFPFRRGAAPGGLDPRGRGCHVVEVLGVEEDGPPHALRLAEDAREVIVCDAGEGIHAGDEVAFEAHDTAGREGGHRAGRASFPAEAGLGRVAGNPAEEGIVDDRGLRDYGELVVEGFGRRNGREGGAGHVDHGRDAASGRLARAVEEVLAVGETRLVEVDVRIYGAGEDEKAGCVHGPFAVRRSKTLCELDEAAILDPEVGARESVPAGQGEEAVLHDHGRAPWM